MSGLGLLGFLGLPQWGQYLTVGILIFILISCTAVVISRAGRNPYFAFLILIPYIQIAAIWYLAFSAWPPADKKPST